MGKALLGVLAAVLVAIVAAHYAYQVASDPGNHAEELPWARNSMEFVAWNNEKWTAWIHEDSFEHAPQNTGRWSRHSNPSIAYTDWDGEPWQARIDGDEFLLAHQGNWSEDVDRSLAIRYRDWSGNKRLRTVAELRR